MQPLEQALAEGLATLGLNLTEAQQSQHLAYLELLAKWNRVYNLTAVRDPQEMLTHHLLDSLAALPAGAADRLEATRPCRAARRARCRQWGRPAREWPGRFRASPTGT